jgi:hypothetical protein
MSPLYVCVQGKSDMSFSKSPVDLMLTSGTSIISLKSLWLLGMDVRSDVIESTRALTSVSLKSAKSCNSTALLEEPKAQRSAANKMNRGRESFIILNRAHNASATLFK